MGLSAIRQFTNNPLAPFYGDIDDALALSVRLKRNTQFSKGQILAPYTVANDVQSVQGSTNITGGTYTITWLGMTTTSLAYNANSATVQAALEDLPGVGSGNVTVSGGHLGTGTPFTVTAAGTLVSRQLPNLSVDTSALTGSDTTVTVSKTTYGVAAGTMAAVTHTKIADPGAFSAFSVSVTGTGTWAIGAYSVQGAWRNANGSTLAGECTIVVGDGSKAIRVAAINTSNTPDDATYLDVYVNGCHVYEIAVSTPGTGGNVAQTDIANASGGTGAPLPATNTAFTATDGTINARAVLPFDCYTDSDGKIILGDTNSVAEGDLKLDTVPAYFSGVFKTSDLVGFSQTALDQLNGRVLQGTVSSGVIAF